MSPHVAHLVSFRRVRARDDETRKLELRIHVRFGREVTARRRLDRALPHTIEARQTGSQAPPEEAFPD